MPKCGVKRRATSGELELPARGRQVAGYDETGTAHFLGLRRADYRGPAEFGWKLHLSLEHDADNVATAWERVILPLLTKVGWIDFKLAKLDALQDDAAKKAAQGKTITMYLEYERCNTRQLKYLLMSMEYHLKRFGIRPGDLAGCDQPINGSHYFSYRNERGYQNDTGGRLYIPAEGIAEAMRDRANGGGGPKHNPYKHKDRFGLASIDLSKPLTVKVIKTKPMAGPLFSIVRYQETIKLAPMSLPGDAPSHARGSGSKIRHRR